MTANNDQFLRKIGLILFKEDKGLDLSAFHIKFEVKNADRESPNNCAVRIYNLSKQTIYKICGDGTNEGEFTGLVLNAGYEHGNYGVIFQGTIKQYKIGRDNATDTYLELYASDGDIGYNQGVVNTSLVKGTVLAKQAQVIQQSMQGTKGLETGALKIDMQHTPSLRGTVLWGMSRARMRNVASTLDASWSIQNGQVVLLDNTGYLPGTAIKINVGTGLIGIPEQTNGGIELKCLLNSRLRIGGLCQLNNAEIIQLAQQNPKGAPIAYNQWAVLPNTAMAADGVYRMFVVEHEGDNRGGPWYSRITCLAVDLTTDPDLSVDSR